MNIAIPTDIDTFAAQAIYRGPAECIYTQPEIDLTGHVPYHPIGLRPIKDAIIVALRSDGMYVFAPLPDRPGYTYIVDGSRHILIRAGYDPVADTLVCYDALRFD